MNATVTWTQQLRDAITDPATLLAQLQINPAQFPAWQGPRSFPLRVPQAYVRRMRPGDPNDPLLRQVLPDLAEQDLTEGTLDPVGDGSSEVLPGLLHKYDGRALLLVTGVCAVHCRYCFRRHYPYGDSNPLADRGDAVIDWLEQHPDIEEVILSGGDPLVLPDARLAALVARLNGVPSVRRLRLHTRMPVVLPDRICDELLQWLQSTRARWAIVLHINHAQEIDAELRRAVEQLRTCGAKLYNQAVLLRGINDTTAAQVDLQTTLFAIGVQPYYLHQLDPVAGAGHFEVPVEKGQILMQELRSRLPGYLVPKYVVEIAGEPGKRPL